VASASDDCTVKLWDARVRGEVATLEHDYPVTSVAYGTDLVYSGGLDNCIYAWDNRTFKKTMRMSGHEDTITSLALHPKNTQLLSYSMDSTLKTWDIQPFTSQKNRHLKTFTGGKTSAEKGLLKCAWSPDGSMVTAGSSDRMVHIWDEVTTEEVSMESRVSGECILFSVSLTSQFYFPSAALSTPGSFGLCQYSCVSSKGKCYCFCIVGQVHLCRRVGAIMRTTIERIESKPPPPPPRTAHTYIASSYFFTSAKQVDRKVILNGPQHKTF
jgi:WD40 repeat protein